MNMKRTMKTVVNATMKAIKTIATIGFIVLCICLFNGIQAQAAEPTQESNWESVIDTNQISDFVVNGEAYNCTFMTAAGIIGNLKQVQLLIQYQMDMYSMMITT